VVAVAWVKKPWGQEARATRNPHLTYTFLQISPGQSTSLHCHPEKTTSLICLSGSGSCEFMRATTTIETGAHLSIRNGLFHRVTNTHDSELLILETENPTSADDIVRLHDFYNREELGYESQSNLRPSGSIYQSAVDALMQGTKAVGRGWAWEFHPMSKLLIERGNSESRDLYILDTGGIYEERKQKLVLRPGDVVGGYTLDVLLGRFSWLQESTVLKLTFCDTQELNPT